MPNNLPKVYLETTVVSYLTARPHRDIVVAGHQQSTRDWWETARNRFDVYTSELVVQEASRGDPVAAQERLTILQSLPELKITVESLEFAKDFVTIGAIPPGVMNDAVHLAIAALNGIQYLVTWNCAHLANPQVYPKIVSACRAAGWLAPAICTPDVLMENLDVD